MKSDNSLTWHSLDKLGHVCQHLLGWLIAPFQIKVNTIIIIIYLIGWALTYYLISIQPHFLATNKIKAKRVKTTRRTKTNTRKTNRRSLKRNSWSKSKMQKLLRNHYLFLKSLNQSQNKHILNLTEKTERESHFRDENTIQLKKKSRK